MFSSNKKIRRVVAPLAAAAVMFALAVPMAHADDDDDGILSQRIVTADFNHDGIADIAQIEPGTKSTPGKVEIALGKPKGADAGREQDSRQEIVQNNDDEDAAALKFEVGPTPQAMAVGDFNGDGNADLIVGDDDGSLRVFFGDGKGGFMPAAATTHMDSVVSIAVADFNHDGVLDVVVSDWRATSVTVLLGVGDGSFRKGWSFPLRMAGSMPLLMTADFNHDSIPDIAVVYRDESGYTFDVMVGNNTGMFLFSPTLSATIDPSAACIPEQLVETH